MDPTKKELYTAKRASGVNCDDPNIADAWQRLRSDDDPMNWMLMYLATNTSIAVKSSGSGGIEEFISNMNDDEILFGAFRAQVSGGMKFFHVFFTGSNVSGIKKGKASMFESGVFQALDGAHGKLTFSNGLEDMTIENLSEQLKKLSRTDDIIFI